MSENQTVPGTVTSAKTEPMHRESLELERRRALNHNRFRWSFFGGLIFLVVSFVLVGVTKGSWWLMTPAIISLGAATSFYALERGRHPAWGLLSLPGLALLNVMPDLHAARLDEIDFRMTGAAPKRVSGERLSQAIFLPLVPFFAESLNLNAELGIPPGIQRHWAIIFAPLGLYHAIRLIFDARSQGKSPVLPIAVTVWAGFMTAVAANMLVRDFDRPKPLDQIAVTASMPGRNGDQRVRQEETIAGNYAVVRLPLGWQRNSQSQDADVDLAAINDSKGLLLRVSTVARENLVGMTLEAFAANSVKQLQAVPSGPLKRTVAGRQTIQYELRNTTEGTREITYRLAFWETERRYYIVSGWGETHKLKLQTAELQTVMDDVRAIQ